MALIVSLGWAVALLCACAPEVPDHSLRIQVLVVEPVVNARVQMWWLDRDGHPLRRDGRRSEDAALTADNALAEGQTDARGMVELRTGPAYGLIALTATGGTTRDPWVVPADGSGPDTGPDAGPDTGPDAGDVTPEITPEITNDVELRSVLIDFIPGPASHEVVITPLTTLAVRLGEHRLAHPFKEGTYPEAMARAFDLLSTHFWGLDLTRPPGTGPSPSGFDLAVEYTLALHGLATLAHRIAEASGSSGRGFHTLSLLEALLRDASDDRVLLDGIGQEGQIVVGACSPPAALCALDSHTLRAHLASALAFDFLPSAQHNHTGLSLADARLLIEDLRLNVERELFGDTGAIELDGPAPILEIASSPVYDERQDTITFGEHAVPIHAPGADALVDLAQEAACPTVGKHIHRLADPDDNALRWEITVYDRTGWSSTGAAPAPLAYRVKRRDPLAASDVCSTEAGPAWLTDWLSTDGVGSEAEGGISYEVVLLRDDVPALADVAEGELEIVFRGQDALGREAVACRCWNHVLLPAPLEVGDITVATGVGSLMSRGLHPGDNLAPLLNGVPLDQAVVLASFELRNGTDAPTYVRTSVEQPLVRFTKCWQRSNAELSSTSVPDPDCLAQRTCLSTFPPDRQTVVVVDAGVIEDLVTGVRVQDTSPASDAVIPCAPSQPGVHCVGPRLSPAAARISRVDLLLSDLGALSPRTADEPLDYYFESTLEPPNPASITGAISEGIFRVCRAVDLGLCVRSGYYQYYRSLTAAELIMEDSLSVRVAMVPAPHLRLSPTPDVITKLESFAWSTHEQPLPPFTPSLPPFEPVPACPIPGGSAR